MFNVPLNYILEKQTLKNSILLQRMRDIRVEIIILQHLVIKCCRLKRKGYIFKSWMVELSGISSDKWESQHDLRWHRSGNNEGICCLRLIVGNACQLFCLYYLHTRENLVFDTLQEASRLATMVPGYAQLQQS